MLDELLQERPANPLALLTLAETRQKQERYQAAIETYRRASAVGIPLDDVRQGLAFCHFNLGATAYRTGDVEAAAKHYEEALHHDASDGEAAGHLAIALGRAGYAQRAFSLPNVPLPLTLTFCGSASMSERCSCCSTSRLSHWNN